MKKIAWNSYIFGRKDRPAKGVLCDRYKANACEMRALFYGSDRIGPRIYYLYRCPHHGMIRVRANPNNPQDVP